MTATPTLLAFDLSPARWLVVDGEWTASPPQFGNVPTYHCQESLKSQDLLYLDIVMYVMSCTCDRNQRQVIDTRTIRRKFRMYVLNS